MSQSDYPTLRAQIARARKYFLAPFAEKQTRSYDKGCPNIYLYIIYIYIYIYIYLYINIFILKLNAN